MQSNMGLLSYLWYIYAGQVNSLIQLEGTMNKGIYPSQSAQYGLRESVGVVHLNKPPDEVPVHTTSGSCEVFVTVSSCLQNRHTRPSCTLMYEAKGKTNNYSLRLHDTFSHNKFVLHKHTAICLPIHLTLIAEKPVSRASLYMVSS